MVFVSVWLLVVLADQLSKTWIRSHLEIGQSLFDVGFFRIIRIYNTGAVFGIFKDQSLIFIIVAIIGIIVILLLVFLMRSRWPFLDNMLVRTGIGLIIGGTTGNLIDRFLFNGRVTDFLDFKVWPAFNIADSSSVVGSIIVACYLIFLSQPVKNQK
jgi:signal peptidase II